MDADLFWHFYILLIFLFESPCEPDSFTWIKLIFVVNGLAGSDVFSNSVGKYFFKSLPFVYFL